MRPLTDTLPKPLLPLGGKPIIAWLLERLARAGYAEVIINTAWLGPLIADSLGDGSAFGLRIRYSHEGERALETGGGILHALPKLGTAPFAVVNGDVFCEHPLHLPTLAPGMLAHLVMVPNPAHHPRGDFALADGRVMAAGERHTYSGIGVYHPDLFRGIAERRFPLAPLLQAAIEEGRVSGELWSGDWHDVGAPDRYAALAARFR